MDSPDAPDTSAQVAMQTDIANRQLDMADRAYQDQKALVDQFLPLFQNQAQMSLDQQAKTNERADTQWKNYEANFLPLEQKFAQQAADYNTVGRQTQDADRAAAGVAQEFGLARQRMAEDTAAAGVLPGSGRAQAARNQLGLQEAVAKAGAADAARRQTEATGLSLMNSAIGVGRGQVAGGLQAADLSLRQGSSAQGSAGGAVGLAGAPSQQAISGYGAAGSSNQGAANIMSQSYQNQLAGQSQQNALFGDVLGAGLGVAGMFMSSEKTKHLGKKVRGASEAVEDSPAHHWRYRLGLGDGNAKPRMGPTAESLRDATGGVVSDGAKVDAIAMLGLHHAALGEHGKRLQRIEKQLSLADGARGRREVEVA